MTREEDFDMKIQRDADITLAFTGAALKRRVQPWDFV